MQLAIFLFFSFLDDYYIMLPALDVDDVCAIYFFLICNTYSMQIGRQLEKNVPFLCKGEPYLYVGMLLHVVLEERRR